MGTATIEALEIIRHAMLHDYFEQFVPRFEIASGVREKKSPFVAIDEIRNAFDHFSKALVAAAEFDGETPPGHMPAVAASGPVPPATDPLYLLDAWRGIRHLASGQYYSNHYAGAWVAEEIGEILKTELAKTSPDFQAYEQEFHALEREFEQVGVPSDRRFYVVDDVKQEIKIIQALVLTLDNVTNGIEALYRKIRQSRIDGVLL